LTNSWPRRCASRKPLQARDTRLGTCPERSRPAGQSPRRGRRSPNSPRTSPRGLLRVDVLAGSKRGEVWGGRDREVEDDVDIAIREQPGGRRVTRGSPCSLALRSAFWGSRAAHPTTSTMSG